MQIQISLSEEQLDVLKEFLQNWGGDYSWSCDSRMRDIVSVIANAHEVHSPYSYHEKFCDYEHTVTFATRDDLYDYLVKMNPKVHGCLKSNDPMRLAMQQTEACFAAVNSEANDKPQVVEAKSCDGLKS